MPSEFRLKGGAELMEMLDRIPDRLGRNIVRGALRAGAKVVADEAKIRVGSARIAKQIKVGSRASGTVISSKVSVREAKGTLGFVAWFLEYGVAPHWIRPKRKGGLELAENVVRGEVHHPGFGAKPFLRPALDARAAEAINVMGEYIGARLNWDALRAPALAVEDDEE
jgi:hypothetical protein